jgi:hypothetical protein
MSVYSRESSESAEGQSSRILNESHQSSRESVVSRRQSSDLTDCLSVMMTDMMSDGLLSLHTSLASIEEVEFDRVVSHRVRLLR